AMNVDALEPAAPARLSDTALDGFRCDPPERWPQLAGRAHCESHVAALKISRERRGVIVMDDDEAMAEFLRATSQDVQHNRVGVCRQHDRTSMNDAGLFRCDLAQSGAEKFHVIEADWGDQRGDRPYNIR